MVCFMDYNIQGINQWNQWYLSMSKTKRKSLDSFLSAGHGIINCSVTLQPLIS